MKLPLSGRLLACADFVTSGARVADVGCDHGYLSIHLLQSGLASSVIAADLREDPLQKAVKNAEKYGVSDKISFYLSDGVQNIPRDFDTLICAGMGAVTIESILNAAPWLKNPRYRLILQCQSQRSALQKYLSDNGFAVLRETLAMDGSFLYPVLEAAYAPVAPLHGAQYYVSPALLASGSPLLAPYIRRILDGMAQTVEGLSQVGGEKYREMKAIYDELETILEKTEGAK